MRAEAWGLTLFQVPPEGVAFIEIAEEFVEAQHRDRERPLLDSLDRSGQLLCTACRRAAGGWAAARPVALFLARGAAIVQRGRGAVVAGWFAAGGLRRASARR